MIGFIAIYFNPCSAFGLEEDLYGKVYARSFGETYNGTTIGNSPFNTAFTSRNIDTPGQWYTLTPYWSNEYIAQTPIMGQMGGTYIEIKRGTSNPWTLEVRIQDYGLEDWNFGG